MSQQRCLPLPPRRGSSSSRSRRRKREEKNGADDEADDGPPPPPPPSTISDLAGLDAASYLASVRRQARNLPDVFVVGDGDGGGGDGDGRDGNGREGDASVQEKNFRKGELISNAGGASEGKETEAAGGGAGPSPPKKKKTERNNEGGGGVSDDFVPIDGSAATLHALLSPRLSLPLPPAPSHLPARGTEWASDALSDFDTLRTYLQKCKEAGVGGVKGGEGSRKRRPVPGMKDRGGWHEFCLGRDEAMGNAGGYFDDGGGSDDDDDGGEGKPKNGAQEDGGGNGVGSGDTDEQDWSTSIPPAGHTPTTSLLLQFDQVLVRRLLSHHSHFLTEGWDLTPRRAAWLYGLLSRLEKPVHRDDAAVLRELLRECCRRRADLDLTRSNNDGEVLASLNVLIAVVGVFFGQGNGMEELFSSSASAKSEG